MALNIQNLFSRRNNNLISHSSEKSYKVINEEYPEYKKYFLDLMEELTKKLDSIINKKNNK